MSTATTRRLSARGSVGASVGSGFSRTYTGGGRVTIDMSQSAASSRAKGTFRLNSGASGNVIDATDLGVLQIADKWASFTARVHQRPSGAA